MDARRGVVPEWTPRRWGGTKNKTNSNAHLKLKYKIGGSPISSLQKVGAKNISLNAKKGFYVFFAWMRT